MATALVAALSRNLAVATAIRFALLAFVLLTLFGRVQVSSSIPTAWNSTLARDRHRPRFILKLKKITESLIPRAYFLIIFGLHTLTPPRDGRDILKI